jgi:hypothetical protein
LEFEILGFGRTEEAVMSDAPDHTRRWLINASGPAILSNAVPVTSTYAQTAATAPPSPRAESHRDPNTISPVTTALADYVARTLDRELPAAVVARTKLHVLDTIAAMVSGSRLKPGDFAARYVDSLGGKPQAMVIGTGIVTSAVNAALANAMAAHADETDDTNPVGPFHAGCGAVSAALASAELAGRTGSDVLRAVALGYDIGARMIVSLGVGAGAGAGATRRHSPSCLTTTFVAAAAAAAMLRLDPRQVRHALSFAAQQASGIGFWERDREHIEKAFDFGGMGARNGVMAATMVASGFTAVDVAAQHGEPCAVVCGKLGEYAIELGEHRLIVCVAALGSVQHDGGDPARRHRKRNRFEFQACLPGRFGARLLRCSISAECPNGVSETALRPPSTSGPRCDRRPAGANRSPGICRRPVAVLAPWSEVRKSISSRAALGCGASLQRDRVERDRHRLDLQPCRRRALASADHRVVDEHHQGERVFAGDHLVEHGAGGSLNVDDLLARERTQVLHPAILTHAGEDISDKTGRAGYRTRVPGDPALPFRVEQVLERLRRLGEGHHVDVDPGPEHVDQQRRPISVLVLQVGGKLIDVRRPVGRDQARALDCDHAVQAVENVGLHSPARASLKTFRAVAASSAREYCSLTPGYFFSKASCSGRMAWFTMRVVYQTTRPSFFAASTSAASAARAAGASMTAIASMIAIREAVRPAALFARDTCASLVSPVRFRTGRIDYFVDSAALRL